MTGPVRVLLPPTAAHLAALVADSGCAAVIDATGAHPPAVPVGVWVRTRPGRPAPGTGPVILAEHGAPVPDRATWLETTVPREVPAGFAGLVLKGREAGGFAGEADGLEMLARCPDPGRVLLDAGVGPVTAGAAAALGAAGVLVAETILACPELDLPAALAQRLDLPDDEVTHLVGGLRVCTSATAPVLRRLVDGEDPWSLAEGVWEKGDPAQQLWLVGQGIALARGLAERHGTLGALLRAYVAGWSSWRERSTHARAHGPVLPVSTGARLGTPGTGARAGGVVGSSVLWEEASWLGRPVVGGPIAAAVATGLPVVADAEVVAAARSAAASTTATAEPEPGPSGPPERRAVSAVAIIGMGCRMPDAPSLRAFWDNIVGGHSAIGDVPPDRWDPALYWDPDPNAPDKTYSRIGAFIKDFEFDSRRFRIPPRVARQVDPVQQLTLASVADALADAGLQVDRNDAEGRAFDRERTAVILGNSLGGEIKDRYALRLGWPEIRQSLEASEILASVAPDRQDAALDQLETSFKADLPEIDEDSMPGELSNVIAGRIANAFDLRGANFTVDAACASSMAALQAAVKGLQDGDFDLAITGGADRSMNVPSYVKFAKIGALSPDHSSPFDASANGFVMGEGCGILVLARHDDAVAAGHRIYALIRGIGASSDGRGKGITAPNKIGQLLALQRAYQAAGVDIGDVDLFECHGTSTVVGDRVEVEALSEVIGAGRREVLGPARIGSVKSMIGHLKSAAGAASVIKAAMALHEQVLPPSIGFREPSSDLDLDAVPLRVQTAAEAWPDPPGGIRRAGVSAFGFGGTNFHIVLEALAGQIPERSVLAAPPAPQRIPDRPVPPSAAALPVSRAPTTRPDLAGELPDGIWATSGRDQDELRHNLIRLREGGHAPWEPSAPLRMAAASADGEERASQLARAIAALEKGTNLDMLRARAIHVEEGPTDGRMCFVFTGQGSQYIDMGLDLVEAYPIVRDTFEEADRILTDAVGRSVTSLIRAHGDPEVQEELLRRTEFSQPATLTLDVALLRLLAAYGVVPDMVAGHSLGEYGAAVAAGIMTFEQAMYAVTARGREMASIRLDDPGRMVGIAASAEVVEEVLADVGGYVIAANKNCPTQTVIAGASDAVEEATERFRAKGLTVYPLPVSHAFHSAIVAPASDPLRKVLAGLGLRPPRRPITTNVTAEYYPGHDDAVPAIIDILAAQISAPVEWTAQVERMYADGARVFVECGPKRALTGFVVASLKRRPHRALYTNHPRRGGLLSFRDCLAGLLVAGFPVRAAPAPGPVDVLAEALPRRATTDAVTAHLALRPRAEALPDLEAGILAIVAQKTGYEVEELDLGFELEGDLGIDTVKQAEVFSVVRSTYGIPADPSFSFAEHKTLRALIDWAAHRIGATRPPVAARPVPPVAPPPQVANDAVTAFLTQAARAGVDGALDVDGFAAAVLPSVQALVQAAFDAAVASRRPEPTVAQPAPTRPVPAAAKTAPPPEPSSARPMVVCSGASLGLPGGQEVFGADNFARILSGDNRIAHLGERAEKFLSMGLVRLVKDPQTGQGSFLPVEDVSQVIRLAGVRAAFDIGDWGVPDNLARAWDITTQLAAAAALEALRDAGIPLVRAFRETGTGKRVPAGWMLPEPLRDDTGIVFASAFPGYDQLVRKLATGGDDGEGRFDRRFLFQILAMGHSQLAQLIGARGPNTSINAACASTAQAVAIAEDWIRVGRCRRVLVVSADDVTSPDLLPWIGGGFMAAGAATTHDVVEEAALPFDRRRHGMILGMGAAALVLEIDHDVAARGVVPIAELLDSTIANSAFHGTRLDPEHIASVVDAAVGRAAERAGVTRDQMGHNAVFMSHETYTPARGGSAAAEIEALRRAFGTSAREVVIANTKGFTGHAMGAGLEDAVVLKALQYGQVPPVANFREPDEQLGELRLSTGEARDLDFALRLAAGFGSQLAITSWRRVAHGDDRVPDEARRRAWLRQVTGFDHVVEYVEARTLRVVSGEADVLVPMVPDVSPASLPGTRGEAPPPAAERRSEPVSAAPTAAGPADVQADLIALIAAKTGYEPSELEPDFELEADLGIDTVKQAEIFSELRDRYGLARDDDFRLADHPTIAALAGWMGTQLGATGAASSAAAEVAPATPVPTAPTPPAPTKPTPTPAPPAERSAAPASPPDAPTPGPPSTPRARRAPGWALAELTALVADKTGYSPDELEPDFELEADLGIDTVKQAEIVSDLRDRFGIERDDAFRFADHPTIAALASYLEQAATAGPSEPAASAPTTPRTAPPVTSPTPVPLPPSQTLTQPLAPARAARPSLPLGETDAGSPPEPRVVDDDATEPTAPVRHATPQRGDAMPDLVALIAAKTGYAPEELEPDFELEADLGIDTVKQAEIVTELRDRYALPRDDDFRLADHPTIAALAAYLNATRGDGPDPDPEDGEDTDPGFVPESFDLVPAARKEDLGRADATVDLPPSFRVRRPVLVARRRTASADLAGVHVRILGEGPVIDALRDAIVDQGGSLEGPHDVVVDAGDDVFASFHAAKALAGSCRAWMALTRLGGFSPGPSTERAFADGARAGFAKSLAREWPSAAVRVVDVAPAASHEETAERVCDELLVPGPLEVFYRGGTRRVVEYRVEKLPEPDVLAPGAAVLITGGARGIGARVAAELARRAPVRLALAGRGAEATEALDITAAKARIRDELESEGERVTPIAVDRRLAPLRNAAEVHATVELLRELGAEVIYVRGDLGDPRSVRQVVDEVIAKYGSIDVCIHGAGVEESRLIEDKDDEAFHRVFDGKAFGGKALLEALSDATTFVSMGSVAGRFGNPGQVDYAAANEAMARVCLTRPRSLHVDWTAWDDAGMAVRGGMKRLLQERGVDLLPAEAGAALLVDLVASGVDGEVVVSGALGDMGTRPNHPLLDEIAYQGDLVIGRVMLDLERMPWLSDHAIEGVPVLPGVVGLELMAAVATAASPGGAYVGARNVRFDQPAKLHHREPVLVTVIAEPWSDGTVRCRLETERELRTGRAHRTENFSATISVGAMPDIEGLPSTFLPEETLAGEAIYQRFFHGPRFQVLCGALSVSSDALLADARGDPDGITDYLATEPLALEAAFQAAGLHRMLVDAELALPRFVREVQVLGTAHSDDALSVMVHLRDGKYDVDVDGPTGPILRMRGFELVPMGPLPPEHRFPTPDGGRPTCLAPLSDQAPTEVRRGPQASGPDGPIALAIAHASWRDDPTPWLTLHELAELRSRGTPGRVADRVAGRIAAKRALHELTGVDATTIRIRSHPSGEPLARVPGHADARVSIAHRDERAVAVASRYARVGVDLERIEPRSEAFVADWYRPAEAAWIDGDPVRLAAAWAIKEAVLKALGRGMALSPRDVEVPPVTSDTVTVVKLHGAVARRLLEIGGGELQATWTGLDEIRVVARVVQAA